MAPAGPEEAIHLEIPAREVERSATAFAIDQQVLGNGLEQWLPQDVGRDRADVGTDPEADRSGQ